MGYNEDGKGKDITCGTSRELKESAFIRLTVMSICGLVYPCTGRKEAAPGKNDRDFEGG